MGTEYILFSVMCLVASLVSSVFGLGTALLVLALGPHILPVKEVLALATILFATSTLLKTVVYCRSINWNIALTLAVTSFPFAYLGASLVTELPAPMLRRLLGLMILLYVALTFFKRLPSLAISTPGLLAGSAVYGFVSGLLGSGNIIKAVLLRELNLGGPAFVGAMAASSLLANAAKLTAFTQTGLLHAGHARPALVLVVMACAAVLAGRYWLTKMSAAQFAGGLQAVLLISALALIAGD